MRNCSVTLVIALLLPAFANASDAELEEKLKAVMILFEKSQQGLREEIDSLQLQVSYLEEQNSKLNQDLQAERRENLDLKTQLLVQRAQSPEEDTARTVVARELGNPNNFQTGDAGQPIGLRGDGQRGRGQAAAGGRQGGRDAQKNNTPAAVAAEDVININSATKEELLTLPLVNDFLADNIISGRPWTTVEDLIQLQGFGPMKLRRLQPYVKAEPISEIPEDQVSENPVN